MTEAEAKVARRMVSYLEERFPDRKWAINNLDELLAAIIYVETL